MNSFARCESVRYLFHIRIYEAATEGLTIFLMHTSSVAARLEAEAGYIVIPTPSLESSYAFSRCAILQRITGFFSFS